MTGTNGTMFIKTVMVGATKMVFALHILEDAHQLMINAPLISH